MIENIRKKLNAKIVDVTVADIVTQSTEFFNAVRSHKLNKDLERHFFGVYNRSAIPYVVCSVLNKAFNVVSTLNAGKSVILTETNENNSPMFTSLVASLVQIIMDEKYRNIDGLLDIIDREWMLLGEVAIK